MMLKQLGSYLICLLLLYSCIKVDTDKTEERKLYAPYQKIDTMKKEVKILEKAVIFHQSKAMTERQADIVAMENPAMLLPYKNRFTYAKMKAKNPMYGKEYNRYPSETIQRKAYTIEELLERSLKGLAPQEHMTYFDNPEEFEDISVTLEPGFDLDDAHNYAKALNDKVEEYQKQLDLEKEKEQEQLKKDQEELQKIKAEEEKKSKKEETKSKEDV